MQLLSSTLRVVLNGTTLIDYSHFMEREPDSSGQSSAQIVRPVRAAYAKTYNRGAHLNTFSFSRCELFADYVEAQRAMMTKAEVFQNLSGLCQIFTKADAYENTIADAHVSGLRSQIKNAFLIQTITITGGAFNTVT